MIYDLIIIGGGAAGFFAALSAKETNPLAKVALLEKTAVLLAKVRVSGGGRCNVTHACFDPKFLAHHYPRGEKELIGPFHTFQPRDTIEWFAARGVELKTEADGRMFPVTDSSQTIIDCLLNEARKSGVEIFLKQKIAEIRKNENFEVEMRDGTVFHSRKLILATGSSSDGHGWARNLGHTIQEPVPSLFTFNIPNFSLAELSGISFENVEVKIADTSYAFKGPLLITHFGLSGPAVLKLSAWAARHLHAKNYRFEVVINWLPDANQTFETLLKLKQKNPEKTLLIENPFHFPKNFWKTFLSHSKRLNDMTNQELRALCERLHADIFSVEGKTTHKEEFVTCGGVSLKEVNFKTMESKICPSLYFAGEILDIDGITGGFNFQNAWTTGFIAGQSP